MPHFDIIKRHIPKKTYRVANVMGTYDLQTENITEHFVGDIDLPSNWNVGLIVGHSGTGKTTIAKELFGDAVVCNMQYTHESILDDMPEHASMTDICKTLNAVGFSAPPSWLKCYDVLSNGEKMRCDLARAMLANDKMFAFDEYTSVVDRDVAKIGSFALQKAIRRANRQFVAITCHFDVREWLMPDWIFNTDTMEFQQCDVEIEKKNRPTIDIKIWKCASTKDKLHYWRLFGKYHYLSHSLNMSASVYIATINDNAVAFCAVLPFPHPIKRNTYKIHRTIVLPDYQGIGIGIKVEEFIASKYKSKGKSFITTTSNPAAINARKKSPNWITTRIGRASSGSGRIQNKHKKGSTSNARITASFEYVGG